MVDGDPLTIGIRKIVLLYRSTENLIVCAHRPPSSLSEPDASFVVIFVSNRLVTSHEEDLVKNINKCESINYTDYLLKTIPTCHEITIENDTLRGPCNCAMNLRCLLGPG